MSAPAALMSTDPAPRRGRCSPVALAPDADAATDNSGSTSVEKALTVLEVFRGPGTVLGVTEVARRAGLSKSTAHRILVLLVEQGYAEREGSRYALGPKLFELGNAASYARARVLRAIAMPYMIELLQATRATVHLTTLVGKDLLFLEKVYGHQRVRGVPHVGSRVSAAGTAPGDVIRAFGLALDDGVPEASSARRLAHIRERGFAVQNGTGPGLTAVCLSAPVVPRSTGTAVAALSVVLRRNQQRPRSLVADLQACAGRIAEVL